MDEAERILGAFARDPALLAFARQVLRPATAPVRRARPTGVRPSQPVAIEREYARLTTAVADVTGEALRSLVLAWARRGGDAGGLRADLADLRSRLVNAQAVEAEVQRIAERIATWNAVDMARVLGVPLDTRGTRALDALSVWRAQQGALVRSVAEQQIERVEREALALVTDDVSTSPLERARRIVGATEEQARAVAAAVERGVARGVRAEDLAAALEEELGISQRRAQIIARDQVLAANAQLTRQQHTDAGVEEYEWSTSGDDRVRPEHERANGQIFRWDGGGAPGAGVKGASAHPGEAILCRCVALPHFG